MRAALPRDRDGSCRQANTSAVLVTRYRCVANDTGARAIETTHRVVHTPSFRLPRHLPAFNEPATPFDARLLARRRLAL